jgi:putative phosphoesterase
VIADLDALQLAMNFLKDQQVDQIVCAGDIVEKGPDGDAAVALLQAESIICIKGNHDYWSQENPKLSAFTTSFLSKLPDKLTFIWEEKCVLVAHGAPWSNLVYIFPKTERHVFKRIVRDVDADIVILGHTHVPFRAWINNIWIFNPGSLCGTHCAGSRTCAILTLPNVTFEVFDIASRKTIEVPFLEIIR